MIYDSFIDSVQDRKADQVLKGLLRNYSHTQVNKLALVRDEMRLKCKILLCLQSECKRYSG
jgi:hypothetical protein